MNKYWFRPKTYGYGFTPITGEGWLATLGLLGIILLSAYANSFFHELGPDIKEMTHFFVDILIIVSLSFLLFTSKTNGSIGWSWGK